MKCMLLLTLVALCYAAPRGFGQGNVRVNEDGRITITEPSGKQVTIAKVQDITGQSATVVSASDPNTPTKTVRIVSPSQPSVLSNIAGQQQIQNLLDTISSAVQDGQLDESVWEVLQNSGGIQEVNSLEGQAIMQNVLQKQAILQQLNQLQLLSNINPIQNPVQSAQVISIEGGLGQVPVNQQVLPDGTVISQLQNGLVTISNGGVTGQDMVTQMKQIGVPMVSSGSSLSNTLGGWGGRRSVQQIISEVVKTEREILQVQTLLQQQQSQLQQRQQELQLQQAQQQQQQNVQQRQLLEQQLEQQQQQMLQQQQQQQQLQENPTLQQVLNQNSVQRSLQKLAGVSTQMPSIGSQWMPTVLLTQGTSAIPVQRLA